MKAVILIAAALALAPIPAAAIAALPSHPDARIFALAAAAARAEADWDAHSAAVKRGEADESDEAADLVFEPMDNAIADLIRAPANTIDGMLAKVPVAMRHLLTRYPIPGELPASPEAGDAAAAEAGFDTDAIVLSLWAGLERLAMRA